MRWAIAAALAALGAAGCTERLPAPGVEPALGGALDVPLEVVTGRSSAWRLLAGPAFGDDSVDAALVDARRKGDLQADGIRLDSAERGVFCLPFCAFPLLSYIRTTVTATLVHSPRVKDKPSPPKPSSESLAIGEPPPTAPLEERLEHLYSQDPSAAESFFASLDPDTRAELVAYVVAERGQKDLSGDGYQLSAGLTADQRRFVLWFVGRFTTYAPR